MAQDDKNPDDQGDPQGPSQEDLADLGDEKSTDVDDCPKCGAEVYEDADRCPKCGHYLVHSPKPVAWVAWIILSLVTAGIIALVWMLLATGKQPT